MLKWWTEWKKFYTRMNRCVWIGYCCMYMSVLSYWHPVKSYERSMNLKLGMQWSEWGIQFGWKLKICMAFKRIKELKFEWSIRMKKRESERQSNAIWAMRLFSRFSKTLCFQENPIHSNAINFEYDWKLMPYIGGMNCRCSWIIFTNAN